MVFDSGINNKISEAEEAIPFTKTELSNSKNIFESKGNEPKKRRLWSPARRAAQAVRCRAQKPWRFSTRPKTMAGKARTRLNGLTHGATAAHWRRLSRALASQRKFIDNILKLQQDHKNRPVLYVQATITNARHNVLRGCFIDSEHIDFSPLILHK